MACKWPWYIIPGTKLQDIKNIGRQPIGLAGMITGADHVNDVFTIKEFYPVLFITHG